MAKIEKQNDYQLLQHVLSLPPSKAQKRQMEIIEGAIEVFAQSGIEGANYGKIAKVCGVTRPLIQHYFPNREALFELAIKYIRGHFQKLAVEAINRGVTADEKLEKYISCTFDWVSDYPTHVQVWILFFYSCGNKKKHRKINSELVSMGHERITALIRMGIKEGKWRSADPAIDAKMIQSMITGALVSLATEDLTIDRKRFELATIQKCLGIFTSPTK